MRISSFVASAAALAVSGFAFGASSSPTDLTNPILDIGGPEVAVTQDFEAFTLGSAVQGGWTTNGTNAATAFTVTNVNPIAGAQSVLHVNNTASVAQRYISPLTVAGDGYQGAVFRSNVIATGTSQGLETANATTTISGRVLLQPTGNIEVLQAVGGVGVFTDIGDYTAGVPVELGIESFPSGVQNVYINKSLAFVGTDIQFAISGLYSAPTSVRAQAFTGTVLTGSFTVDNFNTVIPEPASLAFAAGFGLLAVRRRRA